MTKIEQKIKTTLPGRSREAKAGWRKVKLEETLALLIDHRGKTPKKLGGDWSREGIPALSAKNIKGGRIVNESDIRYVNQKLYNKWMPEKLEAGDIILTSEAPLGELLYLKGKADYCLSQRLFALRTQSRKLYSGFFYYYLLSPIGRHQLLRRISGTAAEGIRQAELRQLEVNYPEDLTTQKCIADILSAFDDKIELNNKISKNLEAMTQAIFKEWFIKSDKLKIKGEKLETACDIVYGKDLPIRNLKKYGFPVYGGNGIIGYSDKYLYGEPQIIVGCRGAYSGNIFKTEPKSFVTHNSLVLKIKEGQNIGINYLFYALQKSNVKSSITGSAQPQITIAELNMVEIPTADDKLTARFEEVAGTIENYKFKIINENQKLAALRDLLLPKLMSGEIRV